MDFSELITESSCCKQLFADIAAGRVSHAYMLCGADKTAVEGAAAAFAGRLARKSDIIYVPYDRDADRIKTEDINALTEDCYLKPYDGDYKIYIVKNAHTMTDQAQNKLLKTLEEPPAGVVIILCAANPAQLLATINSRARKINMRPFPPESIYKLLIKSGAEESAAETAAVYGGGSITEAVRILSDNRLQVAVSMIFSMLANMKRSPDILHYSALFNKYKDIAGDILDFTAVAVRDIMSAAAGRPELVFTKQRLNDIIGLKADYPAAACAAIIEKTGYAKKRLYYNCNYQGVIDELLFSITEVKSLYADSYRDQV